MSLQGMTADEDFESIFRETDVLLVVDDWKREQLFEKAPAFFQARGFTSVGRTSLPLYRLLVTHGAANWHASGKRGESPFLFNSKAFNEVMAELDRADTALYGQLTNLPDFSGERLLADWRRILQENPELAEVWDVDSPYARVLFRFIDYLTNYLAEHLGVGTRVRVVVDRLDWATKRLSRRPQEGSGLCCIGRGEYGIRAEAFAITDKSGDAARRYLPLLGLVDSEVWAFGRLNSLELRDGMTVRDRYLKRQFLGKIDRDDVVITKEEWDEAFERQHGRHEQLRSYWVTLSNWSPGKNLHLDAVALAPLLAEGRAKPDFSGGLFCIFGYEGGHWTRK